MKRGLNESLFLCKLLYLYFSGYIIETQIKKVKELSSVR